MAQHCANIGLIYRVFRAQYAGAFTAQTRKASPRSVYSEPILCPFFTSDGRNERVNLPHELALQ